MVYWRKMRENVANESDAAELKVRLWAVYGFPFGKDLIMNNRFFRYIPVCPTYGQHNHPEVEADSLNQSSVLLKIPTHGEDQINIDVTNV